MGESEAGNGLYRGKPHQAINTSLCTKQNVDLSVYFSSLQERTRHGHLNSQDVWFGRISTLTNKGTEAGTMVVFSAHQNTGLGVLKHSDFTSCDYTSEGPVSPPRRAPSHILLRNHC